MLKNKKIAKCISVFTMALLMFCCIGNVSAGTVSKYIDTSYSTTKIRATATYYTHEVNRWDISKPTLLSTGGKGGAASKSGTTSTSKSGSQYTAVQKYSISATNFNYNTTKGTSTLQWCIDAKTNKWVASKCGVKK